MVEQKQKGLWSYDTHPEDCDCNEEVVQGDVGPRKPDTEKVPINSKGIEWEESEYTDVQIKKCPDCGFLHDIQVGEDDEKDDNEEIEELLQEAEEELEDMNDSITGDETLDKIAGEFDLD